MCLRKIFRKRRKPDNEIDALLAAFDKSKLKPMPGSYYEVVVYVDMPDGTKKERRTQHKTLEEAQAVADSFKVGEDIDLFGNGCQPAHWDRCKRQIKIGKHAYPTVPYRRRPQDISGTTAHCYSFV